MHSIDTKGAPPVSTFLRIIPYALRKKLEKQLGDFATEIRSNSPYTTALGTGTQEKRWSINVLITKILS